MVSDPNMNNPRITEMDESKEILDLLNDVFGAYPGSRLGEPLRDGACIQGTVDGEDYYLEKRGGTLVIGKGTLPRPDISVRMNRAACEYIAGAGEIAGFIARTRECARGSVEGCLLTYHVHASMPKMLMHGYMNFANTWGQTP